MTDSIEDTFHAEFPPITLENTTMISHDEKTLYRKLASQSGWDIAKHFGCAYSGDSDPINHGGFFYDPRDWESYGYASCVEFWTDPETDETVVQAGVINRAEDCDSAVREYDLDDAQRIHAEIEYSRFAGGIEPDYCQHAKRYNLDTWKEWRIWRSVAHLLRQLGE